MSYPAPPHATPEGRGRLARHRHTGALVILAAMTLSPQLALAQDAVAPELLCVLRMAGHTQQVRAPAVSDPHTVQGVAVKERFRFRAVLQPASPDAPSRAAVTVTDVESEPDPVVLQHVSWTLPAARPTDVLTAGAAWAPTLSGWQRVYSPYLGRELTWGCALVTAGAVPKGADDADGTVPPLTIAPAAVATAQPAGPVVRVAWVGDIMLADGPGRLIRQGGNPFAPMAASLARADLRVGNLECVVARGGKALAKPWTFRAHPRVLPLLQRHVDVVSLANNHSGDYGPAAFTEMLDRLDRAGLPYVGGGRDRRDAHRIRVIERKGVRLAILGFNEMFPRRFEAGDAHPGIAWSDDEQVLHDIRMARTQADVVIPFMHWGQEGNLQAHARQRALARRMIQAGADAVVGAHPHVVQDTEVIDGKPVIYSLGNFVFDGFSDTASRTGAVLWMDLTRQGVTAWHLETVHLDQQGTPHPASRSGAPTVSGLAPRVR